ncbi:MAG: hypothetical protein EAZ89_04880 [Bacteroidetes bacterium]|nr:MAG: hypothetical protein EAZ89_04880 [Bacteroidota bacterium]
MDYSAFFEPLHPGWADVLAAQAAPETLGRHTWAHVSGSHFPDWEAADLLILGCGAGEDLSAEAIREQFYRLTLPHEELRIADLGNLRPKESPDAMAEMLAYVAGGLIRAGKTVLLLGGDSTVAWGQYLSYESLGRQCEYVHVSPRLCLEDSDLRFDKSSVNHKIIHHRPGYLFQMTNLGYQRYFVRASELAMLKEAHHGVLRYGDIAGQISQAEPPLRTADIVCLDLTSLRFADAPGSADPSPGGFSVMEFCRLARYAGMGYHVNSLSITGLRTENDLRSQTALLGAMALWYFIEGYYNRWDDYPLDDRSNMRQYTVEMRAGMETIRFYTHLVTGRWWMEVPFQDSMGRDPARSRLVACAESDYEAARRDEVPELWWMIFNKLT